MSLESRSLSDAHPLLAEKVLLLREEYAQRHAPRCLLVASVWRDQRLQEALHAQGRVPRLALNALRESLGLPPLGEADAATVVTWTNESKHCLRPSRAVDLAVVVDPDGPAGPSKPVILWRDEAGYAAMGQIAKSLGLVWGGDWRRRDLCHVELPAESGAQREEH